MATNPYNDTPGPPSNKRRTQVNQDELNSLFPPMSSVSEFVGNTFNSSIDTTREFASEITSSFGLAKKSRSRHIGAPPEQRPKNTATAQWRNTINNPDWRVKLSLPSQFSADKLLAPLAANNGLVFPYTPTIILGHSANYNSLQPVHTNYPFQVYENSSVQEIVITGDFTVENSSDGQYWVAAIHYLRSVTKMFYGSGDNSGSPPPRIKLNGYGDYVFNNVPCVVTNFTVDLPADVDYISVPMNVTAPTAGDGRLGSNGQGVAWVPSSSLVTVTLHPAYSRTTISKFNLNDFVNGSYITNNGGFI